MLQNIQYGNLDINQEEIKRIANQLNLGNLIDSLPEGIDSCVGEKGSKLSGGERQRVCIARALVKDSQVLIFDEASSALDALTEHTISKLLIQSDNYSDKTSIFITHRLKTIQNCDVIHLINNCGVLESGTHLQLINKPEGIYKQMWEKQQSDLIQD
ncbi:MAG: ATP-binding cassette sub- B member 7, mitochondrial [Marteilia pararefringens]